MRWIEIRGLSEIMSLWIEIRGLSEIMSLRWKGPNFVFWSQLFLIVAVTFHVTHFWDLYVQRTFLRMWKTVAHEQSLLGQI